jgi:hypothetical protein
MNDHPSTATPAPPPSDDPPALDSFRDAGWQITSSPHVWIATRITGTASRTIAANSPEELLERLIGVEESEPPPRPPPEPPSSCRPRSDSQERMST